MKCCEGEEGDDGDRKQVYTYFGKKVRESLSRLSDNECKLATNKMLGYYDMPRVTGETECDMYCSFLDRF